MKTIANTKTFQISQFQSSLLAKFWMFSTWQPINFHLGIIYFEILIIFIRIGIFQVQI